MKIIFTIQHAGNVHFFKHAVRELLDSNHSVYVFAREQEIVGDLLSAYRIPHELLCEEPNNLFGLGWVQLCYETALLKRARSIDPDYILSSHGIAASHVATLVDAESHIYIDTETTLNHGNRLTLPFADRIYSPDSFQEEYGENHIRYSGYHELAYLHPNRFKPDPSVLSRDEIDPTESYAVCRFGAFKSNHDIGKEGISETSQKQILNELGANGRVFVSNESGSPLPSPAEPIPVSPANFHHLLAFADLVVGDVATTTLESAILGTPTVRISPFAGSTDMGKFNELATYGLIRSFSTSRESKAVETVRRLHRDPDTANEWERNRERMLSSSIDVTEHILDQICLVGN